jgi:hypothetical protein
MHDGLPAIQHLEHLAQSRRRADHRRSLAVDDARLLAVARRTVDLSPGFAVRYQHVQGDPGQQRALAVLLWYLDVAHAMPPRAVRLEPAEEFPEHVLLPGQQQKRLPGRLALGVLQHLLEESEHSLGFGLVDAGPASRGL